MFQNILVPIDLTEDSLKALDAAAGLVSCDGGNLTLLHVIQTIDDTDPEEFGDFYQELKRRAETRMNEIRKRYQERIPNLCCQIILGKRALGIIKFAEEHQVDLIAIASHKIDQSVVGQSFGTISYKVGILAQCPVLLVK